MTIVTKSPYKPLCAPCYHHLNPDIEVPTCYLTRQNFIDKFLRESLVLQPTESNRTVGGCSLYRPDWFYECKTHSVIVECDENGHNDKDNYSCENKRMMSLFQDLGNRPLVMIRFNPDYYEKKCCFTHDERKIIHPVPEVWRRRSTMLLEHLTHHLENIPEKEVTVVYLYYKGQAVPVVEKELDAVPAEQSASSISV